MKWAKWLENWDMTSLKIKTSCLDYLLKALFPAPARLIALAFTLTIVIATTEVSVLVKAVNPESTILFTTIGVPIILTYPFDLLYSQEASARDTKT